MTDTALANRRRPGLHLMDREPFAVVCGECAHEWTALYAPINLTAAGDILSNIHCPSCGQDSSQIYAKEKDPD